MKITRRDFMRSTAIAGAALLLPLKYGVRSAYAAANSPQLAKWIQAMRNLTALTRPGLDNANGIPVLAGVVDPVFANTTFYQVTAGEFTDTLHPALGPTRLWGYFDTTNPVKRHLGGVIVANRGNAARIRFTNTLPQRNIIPVDTTLPGANQAQNRIAIHLHGGEVPWISDGGPFDWWTPRGQSGLSFLNGPGGVLDNIPGKKMLPGQADYFYPNNQSTRLVWYHDHAHGITRINAYAGLASGYLLIDAAQDALLLNAPPPLASTIPLIFQDKVFVDPATIATTDPTWSTVARPDVQSLGSLWYDHVYDPVNFRLLKSRKFLTPPNPSCIPEFFGDTMLANGLAYPLLTVEAKRYRFFVLNACNARFLNINLLQVAPNAEIATNPTTLVPDLAVNPPGPQIVQIGSEGGYLISDAIHPNNRFFNAATLTGNLLLGCAERADVVIDFTGLTGNEYIMYNDSPGPFPAGPPTTDYFLGNPLNPVQPLAGTGPDTRQILRIKVVAAAATDAQTLPITAPAVLDPPLVATPVVNGGVPQPLSIANVINIPAGATLNPTTRDLTLNESFDRYGRLAQLLGTTTPNPASGAYGREYLQQPTEVIQNSTVEVWRIFNLTADTHPIHFHLANGQVLARQPFRVINGIFTPVGIARGCEPNELGWKETVQMHPGEVTTVAFYFKLPIVPFTVPASPRTGGNEYVWHCHILEHEEHDMMRPLVVV
jgi:spore coat protein A, manganese oxidase